MSIIKGTNKIVAGFGGTKRSIGEVYFSQSSLASDNSGALPLFTGETIASANTIYPEFYNWILAHAELQCTSEEYESALTTYGECAKYVIGKIGDNATAPDYGTTTIAAGSIRLPLIKNYIKAANTAEGITQKEAGLPNVTGDFNAGGVWTRYASGAFNVPTAEVGGDGPDGNGSAQTRYTFDASRSSAIYGASDTVQPAHTTLYPWVVAYAAAIPASTAQAAEFQQALSGKADTNLGNLSNAGKSLASGLGMPSNRYIDLTLGASGTTYTAPANGWVLVGKRCTNNQYLGTYANSIMKCLEVWNSIYCSLFFPVRKGDVFPISYTASGVTEVFRFVYAEGAE